MCIFKSEGKNPERRSSFCCHFICLGFFFFLAIFSFFRVLLIIIMIPLIVAKFVSDIVIDAFQLYFSNYCTHRGGSEKSERELDKINQLLSGGAESIPLYVNSPSMMPHSL